LLENIFLFCGTLTQIGVAKMRLKLIYVLLMTLLTMPAMANEVEKEVVFPDQNLEAYVRDAIDKPNGPINIADLEQIDPKLRKFNNHAGQIRQQ